MTSLTRDLRKDLEGTVKEARCVAEAGALKAVQQLRVGDGDAPKDLTPAQRALRTQLRAHGRQLGDRRDTKTGTQETARLVQESAYEHWHRMLFARFLAEADLLIEPESGVAITFDEVQELAREKVADWLELASEYAERMLPQIFRKDDPVLKIELPPETRSSMEDLLKGLPKPVMEADDSLGWVYQFWQADRKQEINDAEVKIGAEELPAVTQLFTEDYMVLFLLHNTLGSWWAAKVLAGNPTLATSATDEAALRAACKVGEIGWAYLRFVRNEAEDGTMGPWRPAAGVFEGWPKAAKGLTLLDPCMGSGHFLVFALPILVAFRMAEEGLSRSGAVDAVLKDNLFGLEIDPRCTQIAAFNLAFAAWRKVGHRQLPQLNLACSGLAIGVTKAEWLKLAEKAVTAADPAAKRDLLGIETNLLTLGLEERAKNGLEALYDLFAKAPWLGSLIDPRRAGADIFHEGFEKLEPLLAAILATADTDDTREIAVSAQGMAKAAELLTKRYTLVATNVPYLGRHKQDEVLRQYCETHHNAARGDLASCLIDRALSWTSNAASISVVSPQSWLFQPRYKNFRENILARTTWNIFFQLGEGGFESQQAAGAFISLISFSNQESGGSRFFASDLTGIKGVDQKRECLSSEPLIEIVQDSLMKNPDSRILVNAVQQASENLSVYAECYQGLRTGDKERFVLQFWEPVAISDGWMPLRTCGPADKPGSGNSHVILWEEGNGQLHRYASETRERLHDMHESGNRAWGHTGVAIAQVRTLNASLYGGERFDNSLAVIFAKNSSDTLAVQAYCFSDEYTKEVRKLDSSLNVTNATLLKVAFDANRWRRLAAEKNPDGLHALDSNDPTQWLFRGNPKGAEHALQVAVARLCGYRWPRQTGSSFVDCPSVGPDGLERHADNDGIVCLSALKGEPPAEERLNALLADAFGVDWSAAKLMSLLSDSGHASKSLGDWLRDAFFAQHCERFGQRPFIWHIWDGRRDGFHALINYHRLAAPNGEGRRSLEKLIYSYLGDWIDRQRAEQKAGVEGADSRLAHAQHLKTELIKILEGEPPYDIFVRWRSIHEQPVGWNPNINDGVRTNIRPLLHTTLLSGRKGDCILRARPKGKEFEYGRDRGKEPVRDHADYPWFWGWDEQKPDFTGGKVFDGNRWNDLHYSRAMKDAARDRHRASIGGKI